MSVILANKVLIAPVGIYERRLWKSIVYVGAQRIYLITEAKEPYKRLSTEIAGKFKKDLQTYLVLSEKDIRIIEGIDFTNFEEVYEIFTRIIEEEKSNKVILDVTSTTKEATIAASLLSQLYDVRISRVPPKSKISPEMSPEEQEARFKVSEFDRQDGGGEYIQTSIGVWRGFYKDEKCALAKILEHNGYDSMTEFIRDISVEGGKDPKDAAYKKSWTRVIRLLEKKGLLELIGVPGRRRMGIRLTPAGKGVAKGVRETKNE